MKRRVLILCTGNIARSQMAEGWWRHHGGAEWDAVSAGTRQRRDTVHPLAVRVMAERGLDIGAQRPKPVQRFLAESFDLVVTLCPIAERDGPPLPNAARREHWPLDDPILAGDDPRAQLAIFRRLRDQAEQLIRTFLSGGACTASG